MIKTSTDESFALDVLKEDERVLVLLYSDDEISAAQLEIMGEVADAHSEVTFVKMKFEDCQGTAADYSILYAPVYMYFHYGVETSKFEKVSSKEQLIKRIGLDHDYTGVPKGIVLEAPLEDPETPAEDAE